MTNPPPADADLMGLADRLEQALPLLDGLETGQECEEYAFAKGRGFQAMTYCPQAFDALRCIPEVIAALRRTPSPVADEAVVRHVAAILEEWDMKDPPNEFTGHAYEDIARDIIARAALQQVQTVDGLERVREKCAAWHDAKAADARTKHNPRLNVTALLVAQVHEESAAAIRELDVRPETEG